MIVRAGIPSQATTLPRHEADDPLVHGLYHLALRFNWLWGWKR